MRGRRRRGRLRKSWNDNIKEWTDRSISSLLRIVVNIDQWAIIAEDPYVGVLGGTGIR